MNVVFANTKIQPSGLTTLYPEEEDVPRANPMDCSSGPRLVL